MPGLFDGLSSGNADAVVDKTLAGGVLPAAEAGSTWVVQGRTQDGRWVAHRGSSTGRVPKVVEVKVWDLGTEPPRLRAALAILEKGRRGSA